MQKHWVASHSAAAQIILLKSVFGQQVLVFEGQLLDFPSTLINARCVFAGFSLYHVVAPQMDLADNVSWKCETCSWKLSHNFLWWICRCVCIYIHATTKYLCVPETRGPVLKANRAEISIPGHGPIESQEHQLVSIKFKISPNTFRMGWKDPSANMF